MILKKRLINAGTQEICFKDKIKQIANYNTEVTTECKACTNTKNHKYK